MPLFTLASASSKQNNCDQHPGCSNNQQDIPTVDDPIEQQRKSIMD
jgi:hypothetical protein